MRAFFSGNAVFVSFQRAMTGPRRGERLHNTSLFIRAWGYGHNLPNPTPLGGCAVITKKAENCINWFIVMCQSAADTPLCLAAGNRLF